MIGRQREHLEDAHRLLTFMVDHAPEDCRETMLENVPLHRDIMKAWEEHGGERAHCAGDATAYDDRVAGVTGILASIELGDPEAAQQLLPLVYAELRGLAAAMMAREKPGHTLQATALVHEAYTRLVNGEQAQRWDSRRHFFGAAAEAMRRILVEAARRKGRIKRGGDLDRVELGDVAISCAVDPEDVLAVDDALQKLSTRDPASAELVRLRFFAGLDHEEAAAVLGVSSATAKRTWRYARAWLRREMGDGRPPSPAG